VKEYETVFIMHPQADDAGVEKQIEEIRALVAAGQGEVTGVYKWGRRKLAYQIRKVHDGFYTLIRFRSDADVLRELDRRYKLNESVLRHLTVASVGEPTPPDHRGRDRRAEHMGTRPGGRFGDRGHPREPGDEEIGHPVEGAAPAPADAPEEVSGVVEETHEDPAAN
jgi:small subunit ribosomal protein S6